MKVAKYVVPIDEIRQMAEKYSEVNSTEDFIALVAIEKEILSKLDHETLLNMAACMSVVANAVMLSKPSREKIYAQGFNTAKKFHSRKAGLARAENDERTKALKVIESLDYPANKHLFHLRGRRTKFANDMLVKYPCLISKETVLNLVDRLNKVNGIYQQKVSK